MALSKQYKTHLRICCREEEEQEGTGGRGMSDVVGDLKRNPSLKEVAPFRDVHDLQD